MAVSAVTETDEDDFGPARVIVFFEVLTHPVRARPGLRRTLARRNHWENSVALVFYDVNRRVVEDLAGP